MIRLKSELLTKRLQAWIGAPAECHQINPLRSQYTLRGQDFTTMAGSGPMRLRELCIGHFGNVRSFCLPSVGDRADARSP